MPNGRSRQSNTRAANRRRNIQRQNEVNAVAVAAPLVIQAEILDEDIKELKEKIKYYEDKIKELSDHVVDLNTRGAQMTNDIRKTKKENKKLKEEIGDLRLRESARKAEIKALRENEKVAIQVFEQNKELKQQIDLLQKICNGLAKKFNVDNVSVWVKP